MAVCLTVIVFLFKRSPYFFITVVNLEFFGDHVFEYCHFSIGIRSGGWKII
jgi:hypothetical protein